jgi:hypothetical protein
VWKKSKAVGGCKQTSAQCLPREVAVVFVSIHSSAVPIRRVMGNKVLCCFRRVLPALVFLHLISMPSQLMCVNRLLYATGALSADGAAELIKLLVALLQHYCPAAMSSSRVLQERRCGTVAGFTHGAWLSSTTCFGSAPPSVPHRARHTPLHALVSSHVVCFG